MSRRSTRRVAAVLSAVALAIGGAALTAGAEATIHAKPVSCCTGF
jgi:hypothetical protein